MKKKNSPFRSKNPNKSQIKHSTISGERRKFMKLNQTSNYTTKSGCVLKLSSSSSIILHEIPLVLIIPRQIHPTFSPSLPLSPFVYIHPDQLLSLYIYISTIFHDQPPVDDYANYRRNVLVTARNQRKGWLKQRGCSRRYFSPLSLPLSLSTTTLLLHSRLTRKKKTRKGIKHLSFFGRRKRKRERETR